MKIESPPPQSLPARRPLKGEEAPLPAGGEGWGEGETNIFMHRGATPLAGHGGLR
jgi:hypothetical protein